MTKQNIAVAGSGISGLAAAWLLAQRHSVTLFDADERIGGHSNTVDFETSDGMIPVDTGFICFNSVTYPNLIAFLDHLGVEIYDTQMSFSASLARGAYEYSGGTYLGLLAQPSNMLKRDHWSMIRDILRFFREAPQQARTLADDVTIAAFLRDFGYGKPFVEHHLLPMAAAIWSSKMGDMLSYPAKAFVRFFENHGLLKVDGRPKWGTVRGGSRSYVDAILGESDMDVHRGCGVERIVRRDDGVVLHTSDGVARPFDQVVIASHANDALAMLDAPTPREQALLSAFRYSTNEAVLHADRRFMPKRKMAWASWNYLDFRETMDGPPDRHLCVTYWMNSLQDLPTRDDVFVTLNPPEGQRIEGPQQRFLYEHPVFDAGALAAQKELWSLQGERRTWFCGAHFGAGFHEDGLQSGLAVAEQLGGVRRPWTVENESGRIHLSVASAPLSEAAE